MTKKLFRSIFICAIFALIGFGISKSGNNNYISPQINRAVKNKSYFYNCYGKEEKFYIENQG